MYKFNHFKKQAVLLFHQHYIIFKYTILNKICKILHYRDNKVFMLIVTYFIAVIFKEILVSATSNGEIIASKRVGAM
jgi:hypothetical protein